MSQILFDSQVREKLIKGIDTLADAVGSTLGPRGRNVGIRNLNPQGQFVEDIVVHDGVTVANSISSKDEFEDFGISVVRQAAKKQVDEVGDGTTVTVILARAIIREAMQLLASGVNPMSLRFGLERDSQKVMDYLGQLATPIKTLNDKIRVATISAADQELGGMIGRLLHKMGSDGIVTVEESKSVETTVERQEGMQFEGGYISSYFVNAPKRMEATIENPYILITDKEVPNIFDLLPLLEALVKMGEPRLVIVADDVTNSALQSLVVNKLEGKFQVNCIKAPGIDSVKKEFLQDLAVLTGGQVITKDAGIRFEELVSPEGKIKFEYLGKADRVTSDKEATLIVGGQGHKREIADRIKALREELEKEEPGFNYEKLRERIAKLSTGVAVVRVGGATDAEMRERKERAIDAVAATRAAIDEGIVPGGEVVFLHARESLTGDDPATVIMRNALTLPFSKLIDNAGGKSEVLADFVAKSKNKKIGIDVLDMQTKDMVKAGIIDPVKVTKEAVRNAVSVAVQTITTGAVVIPERPVHNFFDRLKEMLHI